MNRFPRTVVAWLAALLTTLPLLLWTAAAHAEAGDVLGPGDSVRVTVFQNPDLTTETRLSSQGRITLPLIGEIEVGGLSTAEASKQIAQRLQDGQFLKNPQVGVALLQVRSRQVSVLGQVARPGRYALDDANARLIDVLAVAGGITPAGDDTVLVMTSRDGQPLKLAINLATIYRNADADLNIAIKNGDTIFVQRAPVFYIQGQVQRAGAYRLENDLNVMQAVSLGGGITPRGTERGLRIDRRTADGSLQRIAVQGGDRVQPDDVIHVQESLF